MAGRVVLKVKAMSGAGGGVNVYYFDVWMRLC